MDRTSTPAPQLLPDGVLHHRPYRVLKGSVISTMGIVDADLRVQAGLLSAQWTARVAVSHAIVEQETYLTRSVAEPGQSTQYLSITSFH